MKSNQRKREKVYTVKTEIQIKKMANIIQGESIEDKGSKKCQTCGEVKSLNNFYKRENKKKHEIHCKQCRNVKREKAHRKYKQKFIFKLSKFISVRCQRCGYDRNFSALDFHHKGEKNMSIAREIRNLTKGSFVKGGKVDKILKEILTNCDILCSNCHREHHTKHFMKLKN